ncbi:MAG: tRNA-dihydrouridine synthase [Phycisphaerae bacterium]
MIHLGKIVLDVPFFQAPLSGYSDYAMRKLARKFGCPLTYTGVMLAKSAAIPKILAKQHFRPYDDEHPVGAQILGEEPDVMAKAAKDLIKAGYDIIDLNFACPAPKVLRRGRGGALLDDSCSAIEIFRRVRDAVNCPLTVKLRYGFNTSDESKENFWKIIEGISDEADAITLHGRSVSKRFSGKSDNNIIKELKQRLPNKIIFGSGDLFTVQDAAEMMNSTGIDGVCIARGAIGNPWIFSELRAYFQGHPAPEEPSLNEQKQVILEHLELVSQLYPPRKVVPYFRKFIVNYCSKRHPQRKKPQMAILAAKTKEQILAAIDFWYNG